MAARFGSLALLIVLSAHAGGAAPLSVERYRAQLKGAESALQPNAPRGKASAALAPLTKPCDVQRADGDTLHTDGSEWRRRMSAFSTPPTGQQIKEARLSVEARLHALDDWQRGDFVPADARGGDAQSVVKQLESTGQIRTGPTWLELEWAAFLKRLGDLLNGIGRGANASLPTGTWVAAKWILIIMALACVALIAWLLLRALANMPGRGRGKRRVVEAVGENADLLLYGPDELRARARRYAAQGDFREALRHLYVALLLELDAKGVWRYDPRRTNWEHIAQLRGAPRRETQALATPMAALTRRFDRVRYGDAPCEEPDWSRFSQDAERLEQQLGKVGGTP